MANLIVLPSGQEKTERGPNTPPKKGDSPEHLCGSTIQEGIDAVAAEENPTDKVNGRWVHYFSPSL